MTDIFAIDDVHSDAGHLYQLLDATVDLLLDMPFERDGKRDTHLDRINALLWIARDVAKKLDEDIEALLRRVLQEGGAS